MSESEQKTPRTINGIPAAPVEAGRVQGAGAGAAMPEPPEDVRSAARLAPDHWFGMVDPTWSRDAPPPEWAVLGQWRSDATGDIVEWQANDEYRPSPRALGLPEPTDAVDEAVQLAATGYGPAEAVTQAFATAEVAVYVQSDGSPVTATTQDGVAVILVFTSPAQLQSALPLAFETMPVTELVSRVPEGHQICLNSGGSTTMRLELEPLLEAL